MLRPLALALALLSLAGCAPSPASPGAAPSRFVDPATGQTLSLDQVVERLAPARVVYLGERHDRPEDHDAQARIARALAARGPTAIGFEMFQRPAQPALDAFREGDLDEEGLLRETEWDERWGYDFAMYRPLVALGPELGARLVALNAPRELTRRVAREGLDALGPEERASLPELDLTVASHRAEVAEALAEHPHMDEATLERFYAAQVIWDETMAETIAAALDADPGLERAVVVAGGMHVGRHAIPERAARRGAAPYAIVRPTTERELAELVADAQRGAPIADVLFVTPE